MIVQDELAVWNYPLGQTCTTETVKRLQHTIFFLRAASNIATYRFDEMQWNSNCCNEQQTTTKYNST